jgi:hypothetical protein
MTSNPRKNNAHRSQDARMKDTSTAPTEPVHLPTQQQIHERAQQIHEADKIGRADAEWLEAEHELKVEGGDHTGVHR